VDAVRRSPRAFQLSLSPGVELNTSFLRCHSILQTEYLPRQARDKHSKKS
jgi:hypothetical protein